MSGFLNILVLLSFVGLLHHVSVQGYILNEKSNLPQDDSFIFYPTEPQQNEIINSLEIYNNKYFTKPVEIDNRPVAKFAKRLDEFHNRLTSAVLANKPGQNVIYSPISVSTLLMMMALGTRGGTLHEILVQSGLSFDYQTLYGFTDLINIFENIKGVQLNFANKIFASNDISIQMTYQDLISKYLHSKLELINFDNRDEAADKINGWCKKQTKNHITKITKPGDLNDVLMVLANAVYFKGDWKMPFDVKNTVDNVPFHIDNTKTVNVSMMFIEENFNWGRIRELNTRFIELPYASEEGTKDKFSMYLLIPAKVDGLALLEKNLHLIDFKRLNTYEENAKLYLPKFKIQSTLELKRILAKVGIKKMFDGSADFRGMVYNKNLSVSKMIQKAFLEVNEKGSTAAAVTGSEFANRISSIVIEANQPFLCAIVLKSLGTPLFYARIVDPTKFE